MGRIPNTVVQSLGPYMTWSALLRRFFPMPGNSAKFSVINHRRPVSCVILIQKNIFNKHEEESNMCKYLLRRYNPFCRRTLKNFPTCPATPFHSPPVISTAQHTTPNQIPLTAKPTAGTYTLSQQACGHVANLWVLHCPNARLKRLHIELRQRTPLHIEPPGLTYQHLEPPMRSVNMCGS